MRILGLLAVAAFVLAGCASPAPGAPLEEATQDVAATRTWPETWYTWNEDDGTSLRLEQDPQDEFGGGIDVPPALSRVSEFPSNETTQGWTEPVHASLTLWLRSYHPTAAKVTADLSADGKPAGSGTVTVPLLTAGFTGVPGEAQEVKVPFEASPVPAGAHLTLRITVENTDAFDRGHGGTHSTVLTLGA